MTSWMRESADERERASDQSLAGCPSHTRSRMLRGRWPLSCDCLDEETYGRAKYGGLNTHSWATTLKERENPHAISHIHTQTRVYKHPHTCTYTACIQHTFVWIDSLMLMVMMMTLMPVEPQMHSGDLCQVSAILLLFFFPSLLESIWHTSPLLSLPHINVMSPTVRARESTAASTVFPFFAEFYCLCLSHLQALVHKCSCVLSTRFYQLCGVDCTRRSLKVTAPREQQLFKMIYWYILHAHFIGITLVLVTAFCAWRDLMLS